MLKKGPKRIPNADRVLHALSSTPVSQGAGQTQKLLAKRPLARITPARASGSILVGKFTGYLSLIMVLFAGSSPVLSRNEYTIEDELQWRG